MDKSLCMPILLLTLFIPMQFQAKSDQNISKNDQNLLRAAEMGNVALIKKTLANGANINAMDWAQNSPLDKAIFARSLEAVKYLVDHGANVNQTSSRNNVTSLMLAASTGSLEIVKYLVDHGANVNAQSNDGYTPLVNAVESGSLELVQYLIQKGAKVNIQTIPLIMVATATRSLDIVKYLVKHGADINQKDNETGLTPLMYAVIIDNKPILDYLKKQPNINLKDIQGKTAQDLLEEFNKEREVNALSENQ